ncbi:MAG: GIY-YIG nuclease family protein [Hyphomicrobiales bacterium]
MSAFVYMMSDHRRRLLYVGVTTHLQRRAYEHRFGQIDGFTSRYGLTALVFYERHEDVLVVIQREKAIKHWSRRWKNNLVSSFNPDWLDLYDTLNR